MRVIAGKYRGHRLKALPGLELRPTSDRLKEALFNVLAPRIEEARFLDCYAGSGAIGIEALSRGAREVVFVEKSARARKAIADNLERCRIETGYEIISGDAPAALKQLGAAERRFDIIFIDPPYRAGLYERTIEAVSEHGLLEVDGVLIAEHHRKGVLPEAAGRLERYRVICHGESCLSFYRAAR